MTIIVMGYLRTAKGLVDKIVPALSAMMAATNAEEGCEHYSFSRHIDDPDMIIISERWASPEALAAHGASAHMKAFNQALSGVRLEGLSVKAWTGDHWRTLIGD